MSAFRAGRPATPPPEPLPPLGDDGFGEVENVASPLTYATFLPLFEHA